jgi:hypothetical protein
MSNHDGSYMLNSVLELLDEYEFFNTVGKEKTQSFISEVLKLSWDWDCNDGEILENIGEKLGICYLCKQYADKLEDGICLKCENE